MKKIIIIIFLLLLISNNIYAKYKHTFEKTIYFTRDISLPEVTILYSETKKTSDDVLITIKLNREIEVLSEGWKLDEDNKILTKEVSENISDIVLVKDLSCNIFEIPYEVTNINQI